MRLRHHLTCLMLLLGSACSSSTLESPWPTIDGIGISPDQTAGFLLESNEELELVPYEPRGATTLYLRCEVIAGAVRLRWRADGADSTVELSGPGTVRDTPAYRVAPGSPFGITVTGLAANTQFRLTLVRVRSD